MKILQIHNHYRDAGGEDAVASGEADLLESAGHHVIRFRDENPADLLGLAAGAVLAPWNPWAARRVQRAVERHRPDLAHVHNTWFRLSPAVLHSLHKSGTPTVMTLHNFRTTCANALLLRDGHPCELCVGASPWQGVRYRCHRDSVFHSAAAAATISVARTRHVWDRDVDLFLALTTFARDRYVASGIPADKIRVKPNFVGDPGPRTAAPSSSARLLFVGRVSVEKGLGTVLDAWEKMGPTDLELEVIGEGPDLARYAARVVPGVTFSGHLPHHEVVTRMLSARALLYPSIVYEGLGMVLLEALAAGTPILSSDVVGAAPDTVGQLGEGWMIPTGNGDAWLAALHRSTDGEWVDSGGRRARALYEEQFTPKVGLTLLEEVYAEALSLKRG